MNPLDPNAIPLDELSRANLARFHELVDKDQAVRGRIMQEVRGTFRVPETVLLGMTGGTDGMAQAPVVGTF
jgi:hypothetical protein